MTAITLLSVFGSLQYVAAAAVKPKLVVEVCYDHFTGDRFRHGTQLVRWRPDKAPRQCTLDQVEQFISALHTRVDAQAVVSLSFFLGLRPSEIAGLKWEDVEEHRINIRRAVVKARDVRAVVVQQPCARGRRTPVVGHLHDRAAAQHVAGDLVTRAHATPAGTWGLT